MPDERPKLRPLDIIPVQTTAGQQFLLRDSLRISNREVVISSDTAFLLTQFDGSRTLREAQVAYVRRFGSLITIDKITALLHQLDEALLLDTARFHQFVEGMEAEFRARPTRAAAHAGQSYPDGAAAFIQTWQPRIDAAALPEEFALANDRPSFIAPHYTMNDAADTYALPYALLAQVPQPDVVVILGTAHSGKGSPFILTRKSFETPFGALDTDTTIIDSLAQSAGFDVFADEFLHRDEHSIEFQTALIHFLYREVEEPPNIVPILCGGYHRRNEGFVNPAEHDAVSQFLDRMRTIFASDSRRIALIASADLSHIGARFGQPPPLTQAHLDLVRRHDMALLDRAMRGDAENLYFTIAEVEDRYNVCGFPCIYALARTLPIKEGRLLSYKQATEPQTQSCVSFASVGLVSG